MIDSTSMYDAVIGMVVVRGDQLGRQVVVAVVALSAVNSRQ